MAKVTIKNTKQEILEELAAIEAEMKRLKANQSNPAEESKKANETKAVEVANNAVAAGVFSEELTNQYTSILTAIDVKKTELEELYGVEENLQKLSVLVNAYHDEQEKLALASKEAKAKINEEYEATCESWVQKINETKQQYDSLKKELEAEYRLKKEELAKAHKREEEEYAYNLQRTRMMEDDAWDDEKAKREAEVAALEEKVAAREEEIASKEKYVSDLETKIAGFDTIVEEVKAKAYDAGKADAGKEYGYSKASLVKDAEFAAKMAESKIESLTAQLEAVQAKNVDLEEKLNKAYSEIRDLASKTVESSGGVKILNSGSSEVRK